MRICVCVCVQVEDWLVKMELEEYCEVFKQHGINGPKLLDITTESLKDVFHVTSALHRKVRLICH